MKPLFARISDATITVPSLIFLLFFLEFKNFAGRDLFPQGHWLALGLQALVVVLLLLGYRNMQPLSRLEKFGLGLIMVFTLFAGFSLFVAGDLFSDALRRFVLIIGLSVPFLIGLLAVVEPEKLVNRVAWALVAISTMLSSYGLLFALFSDHNRARELAIGPLSLMQCTYGPPSSLRFCSLTGNPNRFGLVVMIGTIALFYLLMRRRIHWAFGVPLLGLFGYSQLLTLSRTGAFATFLGLLLMVLFWWVEQKPRWFYVAGAMATITGGGYLGLQATGNARLLQTTLSGRSDIWDVLLESIQKYPWIGRGFGISSEAILRPAGKSQSGHNLYLALAGEIGVIGAIVFVGAALLAVVMALVKLRAGRREMLFIAPFILTMLAHQFTELHILRNGATNTLFFFALGVAFITALQHPVHSAGPNSSSPTPHETLQSSE